MVASYKEETTSVPIHLDSPKEFNLSPYIAKSQEMASATLHEKIVITNSCSNCKTSPTLKYKWNTSTA